MIGLALFSIVVFGIFIFRSYRLTQFFKEAITNPTSKGRRIAYINFGIHLFECLVILFLVGVSVYSMFLMDRE